MIARRQHHLVILALLVTGLGPATGRVVAQPPPTAVGVDAVREEQLQPRRLVTGDLRAARRSRVATRDGGLVLARHVEVGMVVTAGDLLAELDPRRLEIELRRVRADVAVAIAAKEERATVLRQRERDLELLKASFERGAANPRELRDAESDVAIATARLVQAEQEIGVLHEDVALLEQKIADARVRAPYDGVIVATLVDSGEWAPEGAAVVDLLSIDPIEAWLSVPQSLLKAVSASGVRLPIRVDATGTTLESGSLRIVPNVDPKARSFILVARVPNPERAFAPGMSLTAYVPTGAKAMHLTVSRNAVLRNDGGPFLYAVRRGGDGPALASPVGVEILFPVGDRLAVRAQGLAAGDRVIVEGNERLFPMMPVRPLDGVPSVASAPDATSEAAE